LPDYVTSLPGTFATTTYLGNGSAWDATTTVFVASKGFPTTAPTETASQLVDINGDGLDDWVYSSGNNMYVLLNNGSGWSAAPDSRWTFATSTLYAGTSTPTNYYDRGIRFMDLNGDGLPDLVRAYQNSTCSGPEKADVKAVYLNTGSGWATSTAYTLPAYITSCSGGSLIFSEYANFNGNGQLPQDVLTSITNPKGGSVSVSYAASASMSGNAGAATDVLVGTWKTSEQARPMAEACANGKIKPAISFHILRHTWASLAVMNGTPLLVVAKNLGHSDTRMVEKHYGHLAPSFIAKAIRAGAPRYRVKDDKQVVPLR
jgi:FG-GAP-like repeat/Phage integrase family